MTIEVILEPGVDGKHSYYPGQCIKGVVELSLNHLQRLRGLYIEFFGKGRTHLKDSGSRDSNDYYEVEDYLYTRTYLFGISNGPSLKILPGIHRYCFSFQLPQEIPYSLSIPHAEIWYKLKVNLDIPWATDEQVKVPFKVLPRLDLSLYPELNWPCLFKQFDNFFYSDESKHIKASVMLPYTGLVIGEYFSFTIKLKNRSRVNVLRTIVKLNKKIIIFPTLNHSFVGRAEDGEEVTSCFCSGAKAGTSNHIVPKFRVPDILISNEKLCKYIKIKYLLVIKLEVSGLNIDPKMKIPVTIGTMRSANQEAQSLSPINSLRLMIPSAPQSMNIAGPSAPSLDDLPPPFEKAINMPMPNPAVMQQSSPMNFGWNIH